MGGRFNDQETFSSGTPLTQLQANVVMPIGGDGSAEFEAHQAEFLPVCRFGLIADTQTLLDIQQTSNLTVWTTLVSLTAPANTLITAYDLPPTMGDNGVLQLGLPFIRFRLSELDNVNQTLMRFFATISNF